MFIGYHTSTGQIIHTIQAVQDDEARKFYEAADNWPDGEAYISTEMHLDALDLFEKFFVQNNKLVERPLMPLLRTYVQFVAGETYCVEGVPKGAMVNFDGVQGLCDDGVVELHATVPGQYQLAIEKWPFLDGTIDVTVIEAGD